MKKINNIEFKEILQYTDQGIITSEHTEGAFGYLSSKNIIKCHFNNSDLTKYRLDQSIIEGCVFNNCNLSNVKAKQIVFKNCVFANCNITYSALINVKYINTHFENCDLSNTLFEECTFNFSSLHKNTVNEVSFKECIIQSAIFQSDLRNAVSEIDGDHLFFDKAGEMKVTINESNSYWIKQRKEIFLSAINYFKLIETKYRFSKEILDNGYGICIFKNDMIEFMLSQDRYTERINKKIKDVANNMSYNYGQLMYNREVGVKENICSLDFLSPEMALRISIKNVVYLSDKYLSDILIGDFKSI